MHYRLVAGIKLQNSYAKSQLPSVYKDSIFIKKAQLQGCFPSLNRYSHYF